MLKSLMVLAILLSAWWASAGCACWCPADDESASLAAGSHSTVAGARADDEDEAGDDDGDEAGEDDDEEQVVALDQVPAVVLAAARAAVPGVVLTSAELEQEGGQFLYSLSGTLGDERVEIEVTTDGRVLEIERGED